MFHSRRCFASWFKHVDVKARLEEDKNFQLVGVSPCRQTHKLPLVRCRGVRRMHLNSNMSDCEQAPISQFGSSAQGSLLRAKFQV